MLDWLKRTYLHYHHRRVRQGSDHPIQHARRMLGSLTHRDTGDQLLLDLGSGFEPFLLSEIWSGRRVAVDIQQGGGVDVVADGHHLPFRDDTVGVVLLLETLEHVAAPDRLLQECARVLRKGGHLCLTAPQYSIIHRHPEDFYRYTQNGLRHLCTEAGLRILDIRPTGGPLLVIFHAIELNLPPKTRLAFVALLHRVFDRLDGWVSGHGTRPGTHDAVGWAMLAVKA